MATFMLEKEFGLLLFVVVQSSLGMVLNKIRRENANLAIKNGTPISAAAAPHHHPSPSSGSSSSSAAAAAMTDQQNTTDDFSYVHTVQQTEKEERVGKSVVKYSLQHVLLQPLLVPSTQPRQVHRITLRQNLWAPSLSCNENSYSPLDSIHYTTTKTTTAIHHDGPSDCIFPLLIQKSHCTPFPGYQELLLMDPRKHFYEHAACATLVFDKSKQSFSFYGFTSYVSSSDINNNNKQKPDAQQFKRNLYKWGTLQLPKQKKLLVLRPSAARNFSTRLFLLEMVNRTSYLAERVMMNSKSQYYDRGNGGGQSNSSSLGKRSQRWEYRILAFKSGQKQGILCAKFTLQNSRYNQHQHGPTMTTTKVWNLTIGPGIDPSIMIAFAAILDGALSSLVVETKIYNDDNHLASSSSGEESFSPSEGEDDGEEETKAETYTATRLGPMTDNKLTEAPHVKVEIPPVPATRVSEELYQVIVPLHARAGHAFEVWVAAATSNHDSPSQQRQQHSPADQKDRSSNNNNNRKTSNNESAGNYHKVDNGQIVSIICPSGVKPGKPIMFQHNPTTFSAGHGTSGNCKQIAAANPVVQSRPHATSQEITASAVCEQRQAEKMANFDDDAVAEPQQQSKIGNIRPSSGVDLIEEESTKSLVLRMQQSIGLTASTWEEYSTGLRESEEFRLAIAVSMHPEPARPRTDSQGLWMAIVASQTPQNPHANYINQSESQDLRTALAESQMEQQQRSNNQTGQCMDTTSELKVKKFVRRLLNHN